MSTTGSMTGTSSSPGASVDSAGSSPRPQFSRASVGALTRVRDCAGGHPRWWVAPRTWLCILVRACHLVMVRQSSRTGGRLPTRWHPRGGPRRGPAQRVESRKPNGAEALRVRRLRTPFHKSNDVKSELAVAHPRCAREFRFQARGAARAG